MKTLVCIASAACALVAPAVTVSDVSARQRWPWNNLVDVTFSVAGTDGVAYGVELNAVCAGGKRKLTCKTLLSEPVARTGENRIVWDFGRDYPDFKADDMQVSVLVTPLSDTTPVYLVVDLSGGASAASYPVRYTLQAPVHTLGSDDPCKTTELWLKRVKAGSSTFGGNTNYGYGTHTCTLTEDYYLGVFPVTQAQWENVGPLNLSYQHSFFTNSLYASTRPVDNIRFSTVSGNYDYPATMEISGDSFLKRLRDRTGFDTFDLPSEWQWEYAARAGAGSTAPAGTYIRSFCHGNALPEGAAVADKDGMWTEDYGTCYVDRGTPNAWGFYSMLGNVYEWCANALANITTDSVLENDYKGPTGLGSAAKQKRALRGGSWTSESRHATQPYSNSSSYGYESNACHGFRVALTIPKEM